MNTSIRTAPIKQESTGPLAANKQWRRNLGLRQFNEPGSMNEFLERDDSRINFYKKAQLSLTNPRDACEKFARFT